MRLKKGDKFKVRDIAPGTIVGNINFINEMTKFIGKTVTLSTYDGINNVWHVEENGRMWKPEWLQPIKKFPFIKRFQNAV